MLNVSGNFMQKRKQLLDVLQQDEPAGIPEWLKQEVHKRIKKYK
ncbi:hypothetical protein [Agriterribacter sp.]|nr:hypothetical protein [Agriterribacter sp.]HRP58250.1 hypothetical protein [Agriterribacter sp.]